MSFASLLQSVLPITFAIQVLNAKIIRLSQSLEQIPDKFVYAYIGCNPAKPSIIPVNPAKPSHNLNNLLIKL